jgi:SAM-dependent methyltransferase
MSGTNPPPHSDTEAPSAWVERFAPLIATGGRVLDLACGRGRHARLLGHRGHNVIAVDRDPDVLCSLAGVPRTEARLIDLESGPWPFQGETFDGVVVVNYLHRPLLPLLIDSLATGGVLIYETFARGNECYGRPSNAEFLLRPGELLALASGRLRVVAYEDLFVATPRPALVQRICAIDSCDAALAERPRRHSD